MDSFFFVIKKCLFKNYNYVTIGNNSYVLLNMFEIFYHAIISKLYIHKSNTIFVCFLLLFIFYCC